MRFNFDVVHVILFILLIFVTTVMLFTSRPTSIVLPQSDNLSDVGIKLFGQCSLDLIGKEYIVRGRIE